MFCAGAILGALMRHGGFDAPEVIHDDQQVATNVFLITVGGMKRVRVTVEVVDKKPCVHGETFPCRQCHANREWNDRATGTRITDAEFEARYTR